jgi:hypothetical protein
MAEIWMYLRREKDAPFAPGNGGGDICDRGQ